jgi:hypothetical protein
MKRLLPLLLLASTAFAADTVSATGTWIISGNVQGYPITETCILTQAEAKLTGPCKGEKKTYDSTGTVEGKKITIKHGGEYEGQDLTLTFAGTLDDAGKLTGAIDVQPLDYAGTFTAIRSEAK